MQTARRRRATKNEAPARFEGFADRDARFFRALAKNQSRDWFQVHRDEYEHGWNIPMKALLAELRERLEPLSRRQELGARKVFRIHRDVRFSKDKAPYKTHIGGYVPIAGTGHGPGGIAVLYFHVGDGERFVGSGQYMMDAEQLGRFRAAVVDERRGGALATVLRKLQRAGYEVGSYDALQRVPRGCDPEHPRAEILKRKGLIVTYPELPRTLLTSPALVDWLVRHAKPTVPLVEWLAAVT